MSDESDNDSTLNVAAKSVLDTLIEQTQKTYDVMANDSRNSLDDPDFVNALEKVNIRLRELRKEKTECETAFMSGAAADLQSKYDDELLKVDKVQKLIADGKTTSEIIGALEQISKAV